MTENLQVMVLGGCGFIGRHIVTELIKNKNVSFIKVVDKVPPPMAWLNKQHRDSLANSKVSFKSANLINLASCEAAFENLDYDWVINAAGETKTGQGEAVYKEGILKVSSNCIKAAAARKVKMYLEISSGQMNSSEKIPSEESENCSPWSTQAKLKYEVEKILRDATDLNWIIVRPGIVYGPGDKLGLTPRMIVGSIFKHLNSTMKLLWDENMKMNTVHVSDLASAIIWLCARGKSKEIYNVVDEGESTQGSIMKIIADIFNVKYEFCGSTISKIALTDKSSVVQQVNETHLEPWARMCTAKNLFNTPLTPYIDTEALEHKHIHLNGNKLRKEGFQFSVPKPDRQRLLQVLDDFIEMKLLPEDIYGSPSKEII